MAEGLGFGNGPDAEEKAGKFVDTYLMNGHNALAAGKEVGYPGKGHRLLHNKLVQRLLLERASAVASSADLTPAMWAGQLRAIATSDIGAMFDDEGKMIPLTDLPLAVRQSIASIRVKGLGADGLPTVEYKLWDKMVALEMMARHLGLFEKDNNQQPTGILVKVELVG